MTAFLRFLGSSSSTHLPSLLESRDLRPEAIALVLAAGSAVRLVAGPAAGRLADRLDAPKVILSLCSAVAALIALGYLPARGLWLLFAVGVFHSAALAPLAPLSDTLALGAAAAARSEANAAYLPPRTSKETRVPPPDICLLTSSAWG
jgi:MFS transporter, PPP family, 3-phenylpropionic acid transporter